jgi:hypothetical protein
MRSLRRHSWWIGLVLIAAGLITLVATQAVAGGRRGIDQIYDTAGLVGVIPGQAARFSISNVAEGQCRARLELVAARGNVVASRTATIAADASISLRFEPSAKAQVCPRVVSIAQSCPAMMASLEVIDVRTGRTQAFVSGGDSIG